MLERIDDYEYEAVMTIKEKEQSVKYKMNVLYKKDDLYLVKMTNLSNNNLQIILKNKEGVFIIMPSSKKYFKFQSDWPTNSSNAYILKSLINDVANDDEATIIKTDDGYKITSDVSYKMNRNLKTQTIKLNKNTLLPTEVVVMDEALNPHITVTFGEFKTNQKIKDDVFDITNIMEKASLELGEQVMNKNKTFLYPEYSPEGVKLKNEIKMTNYLTLVYKGEYSYTVSETIIDDELAVDKTYFSADPIVLVSGIGMISSNSLKFIYNDIMIEITCIEGIDEEIIGVSNSFYYSIKK